MTAVPNLSGVEAPAEATIALTASAMTFTLADIPIDVTNLKLVIQASEPQCNGITRAYSNASAFDDPYTGSGGGKPCVLCLPLLPSAVS